MTLALLIDVNLSPEWVEVLTDAGLEAVHWSTVGDPAAPDEEIMAWALARGYTVFSHDLDFSTMLALTRATGPSLVQLRGPKVLPEQIGPLLIQSLQRFETDLQAGALLLIEPGRSRARLLPL
jgi:predicted nuclease of predicted toxin-antitoxin system